ncbi:hypothetical protein GCM10008929_21290 [Alkalibacterium psychrotolerans]
MDNTIKLTKMTGLNYSLENLLMGYTKTQQLEIADSLNSKLSKSWKKSKLAQELSVRIEEQAETVYQEALESVIGRLPNQEQNAYFVESLDGISSLNPLIEKGFLYVQQVSDSYMLIIPEEILRAATGFEGVWTDETTDSQPQSHAAEVLHKWKETLNAIYGTVSPSHLHAVWNRHYSEELTIEEISDLLSN